MSNANDSPQSPWRTRLVYLIAVLATACVTAAVLALLMNIAERKEEAKEHFLRLVKQDETTIDPAVWGKNFPRQYDSYLLTADITIGRRRQRRVLTLAAGGRPATRADLRRLPVQRRLPRSARARLHALRPGHHGTDTEIQAAGRLPALPRVDHPGLPRGGRRRRDGRLREGLRDAAEGRTATGRASGRLHRLPRPGDDAAARHPARLPQRHRGLGQERRARAAPAEHRAVATGQAQGGLRRSTPWPRGRRCAASSAASATSSTTFKAKGSCSPIRGTTG